MDANALTLIKGEERYVLNNWCGNEGLAVKMLIRWAADSRLSFDFEDAAAFKVEMDRQRAVKVLIAE